MLPHLKADKVEGLQWNPGLSTPIANMVENKIWSPFSILLQVENPGCGYQPRPASGSHKEELGHPHTLCYSRQDLRFQEVPIRIPPLSVWTTITFLPDVNCSADPLCPQAPPPYRHYSDTYAYPYEHPLTCAKPTAFTLCIHTTWYSILYKRAQTAYCFYGQLSPVC